jgi:hypothetical protein
VRLKRTVEALETEEKRTDMTRPWPKTRVEEEITRATFARPQVGWKMTRNEGRVLCANDGADYICPGVQDEREDQEGREGSAWDDAS